MRHDNAQKLGLDTHSVFYPRARSTASKAEGRKEEKRAFSAQREYIRSNLRPASPGMSLPGLVTCLPLGHSGKTGVFYRRAQRLRPRPQDAPRQGGQPDDRRRQIIINVGGIKYSLPWTTLEEFPLTRLGQLKACTNFDDILNVCDDYDVTCNEFFFDRHPGAFGTILTFLRAGKLRLLREMCALSFQEELLYWGVAEDRLDGCCKRRYLQKIEEFADVVERAEEDDDEPPSSEDPGSEGAAEGEGRLGRCMRRLRDMVERPHSGLPGKVFACLSVLFVTVTAVNLSISTLPSLREEEEQVRAAGPAAWLRAGRVSALRTPSSPAGRSLPDAHTLRAPHCPLHQEAFLACAG
ncbi:potassium voltage-gated channel subfamily G member 1 [Puma concolor]|uniref:Potassium voltage-gated channel subfamily G member 1 n=1 Tax=Puma concolor TaxID=9696 RepID=A0A6P6IIH9_PUMCO|nr:potassium voltage-gated channel subfamily G member 1 [Puma concolor]